MINNAGILGDIEHTVGDPGLDLDDIGKVINTNSIGSLRMIHELWDLITENKEPLIVNISSEAGSIAQNWRDRWFGYCMSKSALNMAAALVHQQLRKKGGRVMQVHPGYVKSFMHGTKNEAATYEPDGAARLVLDAIERFKSTEISDQPDYFDLNGNTLPW